MGIALEEAKLSLTEDNLPIGSVLVIDDKIVDQNHNMSRTFGSWSEHAENSLLKVIKAFDINNFIDAISNNKEFKRELLIPNTYKECSIAFFYSNKKDTYFETFSSDNVDKYFQELADIIFSKGKFFAKENFFYRLIRKINKFTKNINNWSSYGLK